MPFQIEPMDDLRAVEVVVRIETLPPIIGRIAFLGAVIGSRCGLKTEVRSEQILHRVVQIAVRHGSKTWVFRRDGGFANLEEAVQFLRRDTRACAIWDRFVMEQSKTKEKMRLEALTLAGEICVESFLACGRAEVKLHLHSFGHHANSKLIFETAQDAGHIFWGVRPHSNAVPGVAMRTVGETQGRQKKDDKAQHWAGHYYLTCEAKLGQVWPRAWSDISSQAWPSLARPGQAWPSLERPGQAWPGRARSGQAWPTRAQAGHARPRRARRQGASALL